MDQHTPKNVDKSSLPCKTLWTTSQTSQGFCFLCIFEFDDFIWLLKEQLLAWLGLGKPWPRFDFMTTWLLLFTTLLPYLPFATVQADAWPAFLNLTPLVGQKKGNLFKYVCTQLGGGFNFFKEKSHPYLGKMNPFWRAYFSKGLVRPPTRQFFEEGQFDPRWDLLGWYNPFANATSVPRREAEFRV